MLRRLPIRLKLTVAFAAAMALVLTAMGLFLYVRLKAELNRSVNEGLRSRATDVTALVRQADTGLAESRRSPLTKRGESFAQILDSHGGIFDATPRLGRRSILTARQLRLALERTMFVDRGPIAGLDDDQLRLLATPVSAQGRRLVVVVGESLEDRRNDALQSLVALLLIGGPLALVLASVAGYGVASAALRPVEAMRRRAADISTASTEERLPVPPVDDEIARLGHTLNEMLGRLESAFARERTFVADASHELRTPLAILKTELELALRRGRPVEELHKAIASAAEEADRLVQLADDLLVIARSDQGRLPVRQETLRVSDLFADVAKRYERRSHEAKRPLLVEPADRVTVEADRVQLGQALSNLVDNAFRYGDGPVYLAAVERDGRVELHVRDEGSGFPTGFIESAFDRFTRSDEARSRGGTGLGLAIVETIARAHHGRAVATNVSGGGADVWLELPLRA